ncbi:MAG: calcium/sodium antiporter [Rhodospirillales bacterium]|nr:calcium/sodium antiporter [Rhodospirillales bacterium]
MMVAALIGGFVLLLVGAEGLVRGSVGVARHHGVSTLMIGMTVVAFGTSMPELVVSLDASLSGAPGIAAGNIVGSNIANVLLIMGFTALCRPVALPAGVDKMDVLALVLGTLMFVAFAASGAIGRWQGGVMLLTFTAFMIVSIRRQRRGAAGVAAAAYQQEVQDMADAEEGGAATPWRHWGLAIAGLAGVLIGADLLVEGAVGLARAFGVSEAVIGLTLVAVGTSVPELAASVVAGIRGHTDIAVGNILGSNFFNVLLVGGTVAAVVPIAVDDQIVRFDAWIMLMATAAFLPILLGLRFGRFGGLVFIAGYACYVGVTYTMSAP